LFFCREAERISRGSIFELTSDTHLSMKSILVTCLVIGVLLPSISSCKKCMTCTSKSLATGKVIDTYPETCGRKATLDTQELTYRMNLPDSLELTCSRD
jgi:hypothetical protein